MGRLGVRGRRPRVRAERGADHAVPPDRRVLGRQGLAQRGVLGALVEGARVVGVVSHRPVTPVFRPGRAAPRRSIRAGPPGRPTGPRRPWRARSRPRPPGRAATRARRRPAGAAADDDAEAPAPGAAARSRSSCSSAWAASSATSAPSAGSAAAAAANAATSVSCTATWAASSSACSLVTVSRSSAGGEEQPAASSASPAAETASRVRRENPGGGGQGVRDIAAHPLSPDGGGAGWATQARLRVGTLRPGRHVRPSRPTRARRRPVRGPGAGGRAVA